MSHLLPAARGCRGGAKVTIWLPTDVPSASTKESTGQARGSVLWHWAMWRSTVMSHTPQPRVPRSTLPRARQLPPGQERGVADCVLVDPVLLHLVPSRHLQQPSGGRRSSVSRGGRPTALGAAQTGSCNSSSCNSSRTAHWGGGLLPIARASRAAYYLVGEHPPPCAHRMPWHNGSTTSVPFMYFLGSVSSLTGSLPPTL